jgi:hypothetical protein
LTTAVVEDLNVLDVLTADRVVGQISTDHPPIGYVPHVTFLGTRFDNLRIAGHPVKLDLDLGIFGDKPANDAPYTKDAGFNARVAGQHKGVRAHPNPIAELMQRYTGHSQVPDNPKEVECSLVNQASGGFPGRSFGHLIEVPDFGTIVLAAVKLEQKDFNAKGVPECTTISLRMIELKLGCVGAGNSTVAQMHLNGRTRP